ncbi:hypothetical protein LSAT2_003642 [Lamellibrachia satsuma]|nr:hypothetical protein LSAT2_003642 [Lamellibrachia satsuma]
MLCRIKHKLVDETTKSLAAAPTRTKRSAYRFYQTFIFVDAYKYSFLPSAIRLWNKSTQELASQPEMAFVDNMKNIIYETGVNALRYIMQDDNNLNQKPLTGHCDVSYPLEFIILLTDVVAGVLFSLPALRPLIFNLVVAGRAKVVNHKDETVQTTVTLCTDEQAQKVAEENKYLTWMVQRISHSELTKTTKTTTERKEDVEQDHRKGKDNSVDEKKQIIFPDINQPRASTQEDVEMLATVERDIFFNEGHIRTLTEKRACLVEKTEERHADLEEYTFLYNEAECLLTVAKLEVAMLTRHVRKMMKGGDPIWVLDTIPETD